MEITTEYDITPETLRGLRNRTGLPQHAFWGAINVSQSAGSLYEKGAQGMPAQTRTLLFLKYVIGLEFETRTPEGAAALRQLANMQRARRHITEALELLNQSFNS